jgi:hypothetical protein
MHPDSRGAGTLLQSSLLLRGFATSSVQPQESFVNGNKRRCVREQRQDMRKLRAVAMEDRKGRKKVKKD